MAFVPGNQLEDKRSQLLQSDEELKHALYMISEAIGRLKLCGEAVAAENCQIAYNFVIKAGRQVQVAMQVNEGLINAETKKETS